MSKQVVLIVINALFLVIHLVDIGVEKNYNDAKSSIIGAILMSLCLVGWFVMFLYEGRLL